jgi:predicted RNA binding protein with dsRBD fold (UPF0201 family)
MELTVTAEALVNPTEDESKVEHALHNIFPSSKIEKSNLADDVIRLKITEKSLDALGTLRNLIKQERIRSAARSILLRNSQGNHMRLYLNKQAGFVGRVSFCEPVGESPLGPISIMIETTDSDRVLDFLASRSGQRF